MTSYYWSGFATVQAMVEQSWLLWKNDDHIIPNVDFQILPKEYATSSRELLLLDLCNKCAVPILYVLY